MRILCVVAALAAAGVALPSAADEESPLPKPGHRWEPAIADPTEFDWIKLDTGEWLKGTVTLIQDESVDFDSDKLGDLQLDWDDIAEMRTPKEHTLRFTGRRIVTGSAEMRGNVIRIRENEKVQEFDRKDFVSMVRGSGRELDYWSLNVGLGLSGQAGNTEQWSLNASVDLKRETALSRTSFSYTGNVATQQEQVSANNHRLSGAFDYYVTRRLFVVVPSVEFFQDEFQNIAMRVTPGAGVGYDLVWLKVLKWQVGLSAGYQGTRYGSVVAGSDASNDAMLQFDTDFDLDLPHRFEWTANYQLQLIVTDVDKTNQHVETTLSFDFWGPIDFDTTFQWDWVARPVADAQGNIPEQNDLRISVGFSLDLG